MAAGAAMGELLRKTLHNSAMGFQRSCSVCQIDTPNAPEAVKLRIDDALLIDAAAIERGSHLELLPFVKRYWNTALQALGVNNPFISR